MPDSILHKPHEDQYAFVLKSAGVGVWYLNLASREMDCSETCKANFGRPMDQPFTYDELNSSVDERDVDRWRETVLRAIRECSDFDIEYRIRTPAGESRWVHACGRVGRDEKGQPSHMSGISQNITARRDVEAIDETLQIAQKQLAFAVTASNLGIWHLSLPDRKFSANEILCAHFWKSFEHEPDLDAFFSAIHVEDEERVRYAVDQALLERHDYIVEHRTVSSEGDVRWIRAMGKTFTDSEGVPRNFSGITLDITAERIKQIEAGKVFEAEHTARKHAEQASQMKDDFLSTLSHELRTPLHAILGWTQILSVDPSLNEDTRNGLITIERNARAQTRIIEDLLDMSRIISGKVRLDVQTTNLTSVVIASLETVRPAAEAKKVKLDAQLAGITKSINGDPNRLQQVFWNLLSNAVKFTKRGGSVTVLGECINSRIDVSVTDSGIGIGAEFLPHVFDRFRQADGSMTREHGGLGLGLAIVKQLVELHGGTITAQSDGRGFGSTFKVSLPVSSVQSTSLDDHEARVAHGLAQTPGLPLKFDLSGITVLVVDDEVESRTLMERLLLTTNAKVVCADSMAAALDILKQSKPTIIISDIGMPGETGYDLITHIRQMSDHAIGSIPAIALTAYARTEDRLKAILAGFQMHVAKPVEAAELLAAVASVCGRVHPK